MSIISFSQIVYIWMCWGLSLLMFFFSDEKWHHLNGLMRELDFFYSDPPNNIKSDLIVNKENKSLKRFQGKAEWGCCTVFCVLHAKSLPMKKSETNSIGMSHEKFEFTNDKLLERKWLECSIQKREWRKRRWQNKKEDGAKLKRDTHYYESYYNIDFLCCAMCNVFGMRNIATILCVVISCTFFLPLHFPSNVEESKLLLSCSLSLSL